MSSFKRKTNYGMRRGNWFQRQLYHGVRPEQLVVFIAAVIYCLTVLFDVFVLELPLAYFEINLVVVGVGYMISAIKSPQKTALLVIGGLWVFLGISTVFGMSLKWRGIAITVLASTIGYIVTMGTMALYIGKRRWEYSTNTAHFICVAFLVVMMLAHSFALVGYMAYIKPHYFGAYGALFGNVLMSISRYSVLELLSMLAVILSISLQSSRTTYGSI